MGKEEEEGEQESYAIMCTRIPQYFFKLSTSYKSCPQTSICAEVPTSSEETRNSRIYAPVRLPRAASGILSFFAWALLVKVGAHMVH